ncbi:hypothetical protein [Cellulomonas cellasea]|uniref:Uncharacterized protein n=1 Tax=Cellulomonas cellasea TaxID=43670 RepID=A0A7W4YAE3_9CELL|nr:hypothetical protein [Cellulomonas cellasea]MBB2921311.1 hypothetical protein [Cellulomonas cellasea]
MAQQPLRRHQSPDLPDVLLHMTGRSGRRADDLPGEITALFPTQRLASLLTRQRLYYGPVFDGAARAACFTQTTRRALGALCSSGRYVPVGVAFDKQHVWNAKGGPVHYVRGDDWGFWRDTASERMQALCVRLWPEVAPPHDYTKPGTLNSSEWMHEREWRIPRESPDDWGWAFSPEAVRFLVLPDAAARDELLDVVERMGGDRAWVAGLPVAFHDQASETFAGVDEDVWV